MRIRTQSGVLVSLAQPDPSSIDIRDIACHLSRINRFLGATMFPISVAQHSVNVAHLLAIRGADAMTQLIGLLHDAHEAYMGDVPTPVGEALEQIAGIDAVSILKHRIDAAIARRFHLQPEPPRIRAVAAADRSMLAGEWRDLMPGPCPIDADPPPFAIKPARADRAEEQFLAAFARLQLADGTAHHPAPSGIIK